MRTWHKTLIALLVAEFVMTPIGAEKPDRSTSSPSIVVVGPTTQKTAIAGALREMSRRSFDRGVLSRFATPICVEVFGLNAAATQAIVKRVVDDARAAGAPIGGDKCRPNLRLVSLAGESSAYLALRKELGNTAERQDPILVGGYVSYRSRDGDLVNGRGGQLLGSPVATLKVSRATHIGSGIQQDIDSVLLVIRSDLLIGKTVTQIADYAAMRALAFASPPETYRSQTILDLFLTQGSNVEEMTPLDRAYLRELFTGEADAPINQRLSRIKRRVSSDEDVSERASK